MKRPAQSGCGTNNTNTVLVDHRPSVGRTVPYEHTRVYLPILQPLFCIHLIFVNLTHVRNQLVCVLSSWRSCTDPISNSASHTTVQRLYLHRSESVSLHFSLRTRFLLLLETEEAVPARGLGDVVDGVPEVSLDWETRLTVL